MACRPARRAAHDELGRVLPTVPSVEAVVFLDEAESPSGYAETEVTVRRTATGTVPNAVTCKLCQSALGVASVDASNHPDYLRLVVR
jgi:hypothetical protein